MRKIKSHAKGQRGKGAKLAGAWRMGNQVETSRLSDLSVFYNHKERREHNEWKRSLFLRCPISRSGVVYKDNEKGLRTAARSIGRA